MFVICQVSKTVLRVLKYVYLNAFPGSPFPIQHPSSLAPGIKFTLAGPSQSASLAKSPPATCKLKKPEPSRACRPRPG